MSDVSDDEFKAYAGEFEQEEAAKAAKKGTGGYSSNYEELKYTGLETKRPKIVRVLGGLPKAGADAFTARITQVAKIKGDDGKTFRCVLPLKDDAPDHILWRIINRVNETTYVNRKRVYVNETKHKEIFDLVNYNGVADAAKQKFEKGWEGRNVIVMNVIDREQMAWHRENKHSMLLSRSIGLSKDGREFAEEGVPVFGFYTNIAQHMFKHYGNWEGYDMMIVRNGTTENPYRIASATAFKLGNIPELPAALAPIVSVTPLTEEERSWARYDLSKLYQPSSYTKLFNKLKVAIQTIDARLGTKFYKELEYEAEKEKAAREAAKAEAVDDAEESAPAVEAAPAARAQRTPAPIYHESVGLANDKINALKGYKLLTAEQVKLIKDVQVRDGQVADITYDTTEPVLACPNCKVASPESYTVGCPACGTTW